MNSRENALNELGINHRISADRSARKYRIRDIVFRGSGAYMCAHVRTQFVPSAVGRERSRFRVILNELRANQHTGPSRPSIPRVGRA